MTSTAQTKSQIRQQIRSQRQKLTPQAVQQAGLGLVKCLTTHIAFKAEQKIACFLPFDQEIDTQPLIQQIFNAKARCYLPKIRPFKPHRLWFLPYQAESRLDKNRYGIDEVDAPLHQAIRASDIDLLLMPLVAFDQEGNRLGMGAGYYDATFAHLAKSKKRPKFIGLAYEFQRQMQLPKDPWDIPLDAVCTQQRFYSFIK